MNTTFIKDENVQRFAIRGELLEREKERGTVLGYYTLHELPFIHSKDKERDRKRKR